MPKPVKQSMFRQGMDTIFIKYNPMNKSLSLLLFMSNRTFSVFAQNKDPQADYD